METQNLIGKYVKNIRSGNIFGKITGTGNKFNRKEKQNKPVVITNYSKNSYAFLDRKDITWEAVNSPNTRSSKNVNNSNVNNSNVNNTNVNQLNINGIDPKTITINKSSKIKTYVLSTTDYGLECYDSFVINAYSEEEARRIAQFVGGDETKTKNLNKKKPFWTSNKHSSCKLLNKNELGIVCSSYNDG